MSSCAHSPRAGLRGEVRKDVVRGVGEVWESVLPCGGDEGGGGVKGRIEGGVRKCVGV